MRVLLATMNYPPPLYGGSVLYLNRLITHIPPENVTVLTSSKGDFEAESAYDRSQRFETIRIPVIFSYKMTLSITAKFLLIARWFFALWRFVNPKYISVVALDNVFYLGIPVLLICKLRRIPFVVFTFGEELSKAPKENASVKARVHNWIYRKTLFGASIIISISNPTTKLLEKYGVSSSKVKLIHPPTEVPQVSPSKKEIKDFLFRHQLENKLIIASVGSFIPRKGFDKLIQAIPEVLKQHPDAFLVLVGSGFMEPALTNLTKDLNIEEHVRFLGRIDREELNLLYASCELFVMPNYTLPDGDAEGYGMVFNEANAFAKPVIGGRSGGTIDAIQHQQTGLLVDGKNVSEIAGAICTLLGNRDLARVLGKQAQDWTKRNRSPELAANQFLDLVKALSV